MEDGRAEPSRHRDQLGLSGRRGCGAASVAGVQWERLVRNGIRDADRGHVRLGLLILNKGVDYSKHDGKPIESSQH